jgi:pimeloyl-ACP methyl ester carboxylesterase
MVLSYYRAGSGDPLVLIHGIGSRWQIWAPVLEALASEYDVLALDLPGFGDSPMPPPGTAPGVDSLTTLVSEFLGGVGFDWPHVAGNSLGGLIALELAQRGVARSATALSPAGFASPAETAYARGSLWFGVRAARMAVPHADRLFARPGVRRLALRQFFEHPERLTPAEAAADLRALAGAAWFDETLAALRAHQFSGGHELQVPVTIAWGEHDRLLLPRQARRAAAEIPRARIVTLRGCGHVPMYDDPGQVGRTILGTAGRS